ncbi:hypothetical protein F5879DRAFT_954123 [Lentinula edodes]|uniref:uncharacterized protein n=1 Tax=Lentinula edodes TaxID=5353 RepID=UPI001E8D44C5|nr:uncharacterized protein C8R40DRAFT_1079285 [Lentinula edodes]KAH7881659.1 hypothetical protein C8R40DRAFT_1079285 [Lentinula edodes]KAJ3904628.1 hypothetical protein F5879DRAFT_954123 [Lentinula edodes]
MRFTCLFLFFALLSAAHAAPTPPENHSAAKAAGARKRIYIKFDHGTSTVQASTRLLRSQIGYMVESWKPGWKSNFGNVKFEFITYLDTNDDKPYTAWISGKPIGPQCLQVKDLCCIQYDGEGVARILKGKEVLHTVDNVPAGVPTTGSQLYIDFGTVNLAPRRDLSRLFRGQIIHMIQSWKKTWDSASVTLTIRNYPEQVETVLEQDLPYSALISGNSISPECALTKHSCRIDYQGSGVAKILDGEGNLLHTVSTVPVWAEDQFLVFPEP